MTSYAWKMPLLLVREIRNSVREKSVKMSLPTFQGGSSVMIHFIRVIFINVDYSMTL